MKRGVWYVFCLAVFVWAAAAGAAIIDVPHNQTNRIGCGNCHTYSLWWQVSPGADMGQTADGVCQSCHGTGGTAPYKAAHNSISMGKAAGLWGTHCTDCHDPHIQRQLEWRSTTDKDNLYLVQGTIGAVTSSVGETTTFQYTLNLEKTPAPHWAAPGTWSSKTTPGRGLILVDDTDLANNTLSVVAATDTTITVKGTVDSSSTGNSFGLFYGQLVKKTINTPAGETRSVKFFDPNILNGPGGLTDTNTPPQGVCQVCHTGTKYWRSNGQNADPNTSSHNPTIVCTACHLPKTGFKPSGGPHTFLGETVACVTCHLSGDILGVHKNNCQNCHTIPPTLADPADKPLVVTISRTTCFGCHGAMAHSSALAHDHRQTAESCTGCHPVADAASVDALHKGDCGTCHGYNGTKLNPATVAAAITTGKGANGTDVDCQSCHTVGHMTADAHNHRLTVASCAGCHAVATQEAIDTLHKGDCLTCHGYGGTKLNPATVAAAISTGKGLDGSNVDCQSCHTVGHATTTAHNNRTTVDFCAGCHAISTPEAVDALHHDDCLTCHAYNGTKLNPATVAAAIASGQGTNGTAVTCRSCHNDKGALHHRQANAIAGNCTACHVDPRPSWTGAHPGDNGGTSLYPTQLACKQCHVRVMGNTIYVDKFPHDLVHNPTGTVQGGQHTILGIPNGKIQNYGFCLSCHDGSSATKVTVFHGKPAHRPDSTTQWLVPPYGYGARAFNFYYNSMKPLAATDYTKSDVYNTIRGDSSNQSTPLSRVVPMVSFRMMSIPCNSRNGCSSGPTVSVPVMPALDVPSTLHIDSIWPASGRAGITVTLAGTFNEGVAPRVYIGKANTPATSWTPTTVTFVMPSSSSIGLSSATSVAPVMVKANGNNSNYLNFTSNTVVDTDLDGVADTVDTCPNTPIMTKVDAVGCTAPSTIALDASSYTINENDGSVTITVVRTGNPSGAASVNYATTTGSAIAGTDYTATSGTLNWDDGDLTPKTFTVNVMDNAINNGGNKTVLLKLSSVSGAATLVNPKTAWLTIIDDEAPPQATVAFSSATYTGFENNWYTVVTVNRTGNSTGNIWLNYTVTTTWGSTPGGTDYQTTTGQISWYDNDMAPKTFYVATTNDTVNKGDKTLNLALTSVYGAALIGSQNTAVVTIIDDDPLPATVALTSATYSVNENGGSAVITVSRTGNSSGAVSVNYATTAGGTATGGTDYTDTTGTLSWADGDLADKSFTIPVLDNMIYEGNKTVNLAISSPIGNATLGTNTATLTIVDDESN